MFANRRTVVLVACAAIAVVLVAFLLTRPSDDSTAATATSVPSSSGSTPSTLSTTTGPAVSVDPTAPAIPEPTATPPAPVETVPDPTFDPTGADGPDGVEARIPAGPMAEIPSVVSLSDTNGLADGDEVTVKVVPNAGSEVYGVEVRLCQAGTTIRNDYEFHPTEGARCVAEPVSDVSDSHVQVFAEAPYQSVEATFRAGVGTNTFFTDDGEPVSITCGPGSPCVLAVKVQVPNGFGWKVYDLTYG